MDRTNYCADCEQHAREAATLRAQLAAKDEAFDEVTDKYVEIVEAKDAELAEAKKDTARLAKAADDVLLKFSAPMLPDGDHAVYVCQATVNVRTMEKLKAAIDDARKAD